MHATYVKEWFWLSRIMSDFIIYYAFAISRSLKFGRTSLKCAATALISSINKCQLIIVLEKSNLLFTKIAIVIFEYDGMKESE